jgi:hypothetical protein
MTARSEFDFTMSPSGRAILQSRTFLGLLLTLTASLALAACGGGSTFNVHNPPPPPPSNLSIAFQSTPVNSLLINATTDLIAVVQNDASNDGVDWSVTCQNPNDCGSLNTYHSASGETVTYTPPQTLSGNSQAVNVVAFAEADHTKNVLAVITVKAFGSVLNGTYVFETRGSDANRQPFQLTGAVVLDGNGEITSGQQTLNYVSGSLTTPIAQGGSYFAGPDGRGTMSLKTTNQSGDPVTENFSLVVLSNSHVLLAESQLDAPQTSTGSMDLQTSIAAPIGGFAFVASGTDSAGTPAAVGGVLNIDSPGAISGKGSLADQDYNNTLTTCPSPKGISGTVSQPSPLGVVTFALFGAPCLGSVQFTGYIIDATHIKLIESDNSGASGFSTAGPAISQGASAGTFSLASFAGSYVWGVQGEDLASFEPSSLTSVGVLTADGSGNLTDGFTDTFMILSAGKGSPAQAAGQFAGTYTIDSKGIGRVRTSLTQFNSPVPFKPQLVFYLTGNGNPVLVLDAGGENLNYPSLGTGIAYSQTPPLSFTGEYAVSFTQQNGGEGDGTGQVVADAGTLSGIVDDSGSGFGVVLNGTFGALDSFGRTAGTFPSPAGATAVEFYLIDPGHAFFVETDLINPGSGQVGLGYFMERTPVCAGCR